MPTVLQRFRDRLTRASSTGDEGAPASAQDAPLALTLSLLRSLPGRLLLLISGLLLVVVGAQTLLALPPAVEFSRKVLSLAWIVSFGWLAVLAITRSRRTFLWAVRRKLLLSYVFLGVVPVVLVLCFALALGVLLYVTVASYVFLDGYGDMVEDVRQIAETSAIELGRDPAAAQVLERRYNAAASIYPELSLALVPASTTQRAPRLPMVAVGPWRHAVPPTVAPAWVTRMGGFAGTLPLPAASSSPGIVLRSAVATLDGTRVVIVDLPIDASMIDRLRQRTGAHVDGLAVSRCGTTGADASAIMTATGAWSLFRETVAFVECTAWLDGEKGSVAMHLTAPVSGLYDRLASASAEPARGTFDFNWAVLLRLLAVLAALFLVIQGSAFVMGAVLAKSITSAVHELFVGTERVQQGDFAHRIRIESRDQLGELADSFNRMSGSIEHLLHVQREKQRLDDELRIAREIQKSLLPVRLPVMAGLDVADLCEPAREVGGDYYDFFELGPRQLGVLVADVSGKGTSAALYMAELKGLMLALSHSERSPRRLLIEVNRLLADHLDNRSFITMTYAVIDLELGTLTAARAGHTPLLLVSGGETELLVPDGMVLGLRLPGAIERFGQILEEHTRPIAPGDMIVLYTDGITEAMDRTGELFGDAALARVLTAQSDLSAAGLRERVVREVRAFVGDAEPHDDMTMVILKIGPASAA